MNLGLSNYTTLII